MSVCWVSEHLRCPRSWTSLYSHTITQNYWTPRLSSLVTSQVFLHKRLLVYFLNFSPYYVSVAWFCPSLYSSTPDFLSECEGVIHDGSVWLDIGWKYFACLFGWTVLGSVPVSAAPPGHGVKTRTPLRFQCGKNNIRPSSPNQCHTNPTVGHENRYSVCMNAWMHAIIDVYLCVNCV